MKRYKHKEIKFSKSHGAAMMIFTIFIFFTSFMIIVGISRPALREFAITQNAFNSRQTYFLSESGVEDAFYRIKNGKSIGASESLVLGDTTATTTISDIGGGQKEISSLADTNTNQRKVNLVLDSASGSSSINLDFSSGLIAGSNGVYITSGATLIGDIFSSGSIQSFGNGVTNTITGNAVVGGSSGVIKVNNMFGNNNLAIQGNASAHTVNDTTTTGTIYCQSGTGNNKSCDTSRSDPSVASIPDLSSEISDWKSQASAGEVLSYNTGTGPSRSEFGPTKINGNFQVYQNYPLVLKGPLWVTGDFTAIGDGVKIMLDPSYGGGDGMIIVDGNITMGVFSSSQNMTVEGSGTAGSYVLIIGTSSSANYQVNKLSGDVLFYAPNNDINFYGGANTMGALAKRLQVVYNGYGLDTVSYSAGPSTLNFGPDVYSINSWKETQ
jgi:hypothetical protein